MSTTSARRRLTRTQRTRLVRGLLYGLFVAIVATLIWLADFERFADQFLDVDIARQMFPDVLVVAARNTIIYTAVAYSAGMVLGLLLALMKLSPVAPYRWLATIYIEVVRGLPALLTILLFAVGVPLAFAWQPPGGPAWAGVLGLIVVVAAYGAETIRAGIQAVPKGQIEAARSLGMSAPRTMISIVLPQAFRIVVPPLTNELVLLIKDTSLLAFAGATVATRELLGYARNDLFSFASPTPLMIAGLLYIAITIPLTQLVAWMERRQARAR